MASLLARPHPADADGRVLSVTPESADWAYVGFEVFDLPADQELTQATGDREHCLVVLSGRVDVATRDQRWNDLGERDDVFQQIRPYAVYVPNEATWTATARTDMQLGVASAPGFGNHPARLIRPEDMSTETRGKGTNVRHIHNILPDDQPADSLLVVEVYTPAGNWSSYPPHKHDSDRMPEESSLEETYYHRLSPSQGFAFQRVYTDDRTIDETMTVHDGDVVMVPRGYHPVGAPHGYDLYYLNVMAGPTRAWRFHNDPDHEWMLER